MSAAARRSAASGRAHARPAIALVVAALASACAGTGEDWRAGRPDSPELAACADALDAIRGAVADAGVGDAEAVPVPGFPYLRANRLLAHLGPSAEDGGGTAFEAWTGRMQALYTEGVAVELANLPEPHRKTLNKALADTGVGNAPAESIAIECAGRLRAHELGDAETRAALVERARVPDSYSDLLRVVGLYPLAAIPVRYGWEAWKRTHLVPFDREAGAAPVTGRLVTFAPPEHAPALAPERVATLVEASRGPSLGIPNPTGVDRDRLIATFAPILRVDVTGEFDRVGHPRWTADADAPAIDVDRPTVFARTDHTVFEDRILLQITYAAWFPERPLDGPLDLLGGHLDAILWRVTIGADGRPLVYDTIHACGCYHLFFPVPPLARRPGLDDAGFGETAVVPKPAPALAAGERMVLRVAPRSHYLLNVFASSTGAAAERVAYRLADESVLRSLPLPDGGRRSLYAADGLVPGTERLERLVLWPMGVVSPGAMRQWGNHATAFVGRRHFDDPRLIAESFQR